MVEAAGCNWDVGLLWVGRNHTNDGPAVCCCMQMLNGTRDWAQLMAINSSDPDGWAPGHAGPTGKA